jgi:hypothetical protein
MGARPAVGRFDVEADTATDSAASIAARILAVALP